VAEPAGQVRTVFGRRTVEEYLKTEPAGNLVLLTLSASNKGATNEALGQLARQKGVPVRLIDSIEFELNASAWPHNQGVLLQVRKAGGSPDPIEAHLASLAEKNRKRDCVLCLDHLEDPANLGSILRSCAFFGVKLVVIPKDRSAAVTPAVEKISAGALTHVRIVEAVNLVRILELLKEKGYWVVGTSLAAKAVPVRGFDWPERTVLVTGNEHKGLSRLVEERCDFLVKIAGSGGLQSLNAAVATAITLDRFYNR
jgi:23S rRNA (guanosine2251-2'-O)-methyltransferase